jgi:hypothetical protein
LAKQAREGSRAASGKALSARKIGLKSRGKQVVKFLNDAKENYKASLKSRGEAVVQFFKDAKEKYKARVERQSINMEVKGLAKKEVKASSVRLPEFEIESKLYPLPFVNSKGFRIGDYKVFVNTDLLPFTGLDQANHFLYNLFEYVNYEGTPVEKGKKKDISQFFNSTNHKMKAFIPIKYPDESRATFLEQQQMENEKDYKHLRERARLFMNELAEMGKVGDPGMRDAIKTKIVEEIEKEFVEEYKKRNAITDEEKNKLKQDRLREYLNAIDEIEHELGKTNTKPLFRKYFSKGEFEGKTHVPPTTGGKKKKKKNNLRSSQKKRKIRNKTLKNRKK